MTLEELEVIVKGNVSDAIAKLDIVKDKMQDLAENASQNVNMDGLTQGADEATEKISGMGEAIEKVAPQIAGMATKAATGSTEVAGLSKAIMSAGAAIQTAIPILLAVTAIIVAIIAAIEKIKKTIENVKKGIEVVVKAISNTAKAFLRELQSFAKQAYNMVTTLTEKGLKNLVQVSSSLNTAMSTLQGSTIQLGNAFATAVAPIIQALTPLLNELLNMLINVANMIGQITASLFGSAKTFKKATQVTTNYALSVQKAKRALAGFDELNVLSEQGGNKGVPTPADMFKDTKIDQEILEATAKLKELWNTDNVEGLRDFGSNLGEKLKEKIDSIDAGELGSKIGTKINNALALANGFLEKRPFDNIGAKVADFLLNMIKTIDPAELGRALANVVMTAIGMLKSFVEKMNNEDGWRQLGKWLSDTLNNFFRNIKPDEVADAISGLVIGLLDLGIEFFENANWALYASKIFETLKNIPWGEIITKLIKFIFLVWSAKKLFRFAILALMADELKKWLWEKLKEIGKDVVEWFSPITDSIKSIIKTISDTFTDVWNAVKLTLEGIVQFINGVFSGDFESALEGLQNIFKGIWDGMGAIAKGTINLMIDMVNGLITLLEVKLNAIVDLINAIKITNPFNRRRYLVA